MELFLCCTSSNWMLLIGRKYSVLHSCCLCIVRSTLCYRSSYVLQTCNGYLIKWFFFKNANQYRCDFFYWPLYFFIWFPQQVRWYLHTWSFPHHHLKWITNVISDSPETVFPIYQHACPFTWSFVLYKLGWPYNVQTINFTNKKWEQTGICK